MKSTAHLTIAGMSIINGLAGMEHGIGEILQGSRPTPGLVFPSWPNSEFFQIVNGEPAMSLIPNLLASGILSVLFSLAFLLTALFFAPRKAGGLALIGLSIVMLLVGAGFGPTLLGLILGAAASRLPALTRAQQSGSAAHPRSTLASAWPWLYAACIAAWLALCPGTSVLAYFFGVANEWIVIGAFVAAMLLLPLSIVAGFARDRQSVVPSTEKSAIPAPARI